MLFSNKLKGKYSFKNAHCLFPDLTDLYTCENSKEIHKFVFSKQNTQVNFWISKCIIQNVLFQKRIIYPTL